MSLKAKARGRAPALGLSSGVEEDFPYCQDPELVADDPDNCRNASTSTFRRGWFNSSTKKPSDSACRVSP